MRVATQMKSESQSIFGKGWLGRICAMLLLLGVSPVALWSDEPAAENEAALLKRFASEFVSITPGVGEFPKTFIMGSSTGGAAEQPPHEVTLEQPFSISRYEVYQNVYMLVMGKNPSRWPGPRNSAERMTFDEAQEFCRRMTQKLRDQKLISEKQVVRLPTEIEWEYCTRAGTTTKYCFGDLAQISEDVGNQASLLSEFAWHTGNAAGNDPEVGVLKPNHWGLYDVHGYLSEYCLDDWKSNYQPDAPADVRQVVLRGGSWKDRYPLLSSSARRPFSKEGRDDAVGFRCVLAVE